MVSVVRQGATTDKARSPRSTLLKPEVVVVVVTDPCFHWRLLFFIVNFYISQIIYFFPPGERE